MLTRSIGRILRGRATPLQIVLACVLASMLGFVPGWEQGAGLIVGLTVLLIVLNGNLAIAAMVAAAAKLASLALMPVSFQVGRLLLDGPTSGLFRWLINAPGTAWLGLEYYATTGGVVLGAAFGIAAAAVLIAAVGAFRRRMAALEEGSEAFQRWASRWWVRLATFLFVGGGKGRATYRELAARRFGNPIRPLGVVFVLLVAALGAIAWMLASEPIVTTVAQRALERANGATVDLSAAQLDLARGRMVLTGLAMADPEALDTDRLRAGTVEADLSATDLWRKRLTFDTVVVGDAKTGAERNAPGRLVRPRPEPAPPPPPAPGQATIEDYVRQAEVWKARLEKAREWLERLSRRAPDDAGEADGAPAGETLRERLERRVRELGYARVAATHLIEGSPTVLVRALEIEGLQAADLPGEVLDVRAEHISTHPWLVPEAPRVVVASRSGNVRVEVLAGGLAAAGGRGALEVAWRGVPADRIAAGLRFTDQPPLAGGTLDVAARGTFSGAEVDLPLSVTVRDTTVSVEGVGSAPVKELVVPIGVSGRLDDPRITFDREAFADALAKAGAKELAGRVRSEAEKRVSEAIDQARDEAASKIGEQAKDQLGGLLDRLKGDEKKK